MPRIISKRLAGQTIAMTDAAVRFDDDGNAVGIVRRGAEWLPEPEPLDEAVVAKAAAMPDLFIVVEDEGPVVEPPTSAPTAPNVEPEAAEMDIGEESEKADLEPETPEAPQKPLSRWRKADLVRLARARGIDPKGLTAKQLIGALEEWET